MRKKLNNNNNNNNNTAIRTYYVKANLAKYNKIVSVAYVVVDTERSIIKSKWSELAQKNIRLDTTG